MKHETRIEFIKAVIGSADVILKWSFILNGASAAGLFTFLGNTINKQSSFPHWSSFGNALIAFALGLLLALLAGAAKLLTLNFIAQDQNLGPDAPIELIRINLQVGTRAAIWGIMTFIFFALSVLTFIIGVLIGRYAVFG